MTKVAPRWRHSGATSASKGPEGRAQTNRRTKDLVQRLRKGEVAVIRHADLDSVAARALANCSPSFVVNASDSITGRYPNSGPTLLWEAGIPLLDCVGDDAFERIQDGDLLCLHGDRLLRNGDEFATGRRMTADLLETCLDRGRRNINTEIRAFAENTLRHMSDEVGALLEPVNVPVVRAPIAGRHVVIVVRGEGYRDDLTRILPYIEEQKPVLIAVDGSADTLLELGVRPDIIFGDMDSVSDRALRCGAEVIVHAYADGRAPGLARLERMGERPITFPIPGTSEDAAMLLAYEHGAKVIVAVGTHFSLVDFLDKGRSGMASTFLVRLKVGSILVDAKGVNRLYRPGARMKDLSLLLFAAAIPVAIVFMLSPKLQSWLDILHLSLRLFWNRIH